MQSLFPELAEDLEDSLHATLVTTLMHGKGSRLGDIMDAAWDYLSERPDQVTPLRQLCGTAWTEIPPEVPPLARITKCTSASDVSRKLLVALLSDNMDILCKVSESVNDAILNDDAGFASRPLESYQAMDASQCGVLRAGLLNEILRNNLHLSPFCEATRSVLPVLYPDARDRAIIGIEMLGNLHEQLLSCHDKTSVEVSQVDALVDNIRPLNVGTSYKDISVRLLSGLITWKLDEDRNPNELYRRRLPVVMHFHARLAQIHPQWCDYFTTTALSSGSSVLDKNPLAQENPLLLSAIDSLYDTTNHGFSARLHASAIIHAQPMDDILRQYAGDSTALLAVYSVRPDPAILPLLKTPQKRMAISSDLGL